MKKPYVFSFFFEDDPSRTVHTRYLSAPTRAEAFAYIKRQYNNRGMVRVWVDDEEMPPNICPPKEMTF